MKHHIKLVKGSIDEQVKDIKPTKVDKKIMTTLSVALTKTELQKMKAASGLVGKVSNDQIIKAYIKERMYYGY